MKQENKELLLRYLSMALPCGVIINTPNGDGYLNSINQTIFGNEYGINIKPTRRDYFNDEENNFKPFLRPMSRMTDEEKKEFDNFCVIDEFAWKGNSEIGYKNQAIIMSNAINWLLNNHFDIFGLIHKGLAIEVTEENNPYENK